jgi:hypothetical protein
LAPDTWHPTLGTRHLAPDTWQLTPDCLQDRAPQLSVSEDRHHVTGTKFYCSARATHSVSRGTWYFELKVDNVLFGGFVIWCI